MVSQPTEQNATEQKASEQNPARSLGKSRLRLWLQLLRASRSIETELRDRLRLEFKETLPRFDVMAVLYRNRDGIMMSELSHQLMVSNGNVTGIVERLVKGGFVNRFQRDGDRRSWIIRLTGPGVTHFEIMAEALQSWVSELLKDYDAEAAEALHRELSPLARKFQRGSK